MSQHPLQRIDETPSGAFSGSGVHRRPLAPGARLGKYEIKRTLGSGGWAVVYEAEHLVMKHRVAVKVLRPDEDAHAIALERFKREARISAAVKHPNVLEVYDVGHDDDGAPFLVMELLEGEDLDIRLMHGPLHVAEVLEVGDQLLAALEAIAAKGFVHRDVKPHNLFLQETDQGVVLKLLDFGIAREQDDEKARTALAEKLTVEGELLGTPHYMSPEQLKGETLDCRTDIYAAGVTLYELLAGVTPFEEPTQNALIASILRDPIPDLHRRRPDCPQELADALYRALARDRDERWTSPAELRAELTRIRNELGYPAGADAWSPAARMLRRAPATLQPVPEASEHREAETVTSHGVEAETLAAPAGAGTDRGRVDGTMGRRLALIAALVLGAVAPFVLAGSGPGAAAATVAEPKVTKATTVEVDARSEGQDEAAATAPREDDVEAGAETRSDVAEASSPRTKSPVRASVRDTVRQERATPPARRPAASTAELREGARQAYLRGDVRRAHRLYRQLVRREPRDPRAWRGLGTTAAALGRDAEARNALSRYLRAAPDASDATSIRARLRRL